MPEADPAKEDGASALPEEIRGQTGGGRHGGDPVKAVDHAKERQRRQAIRVRQDEQGQPPQPLGARQQEAFILPIAQPARTERADDIEHAHQRQRPGGRHVQEPQVDRVGNQVRADQPVGRCPTDREGQPAPPEIALAQGGPQGHERLGAGVGGTRVRRRRCAHPARRRAPHRRR
jgi:hypothetical protein